MKKLKIGVVGLGNRGGGMCKFLVKYMENIELTAICDNYEPFIDKTLAKLAEFNCRPKTFLDYKELLNPELIDAVLVISSWETHVPIALEAMERGIPCGMEVCGAYDLQQCWDLVHTWERTKTPFMFLENCCYGRYETMVLNMVRQGIFGEIVHCDGCYGHDLREEVVGGKLGHHYRYSNYLHRNCENYPTHEIGPIAKILNINRGNRFVTLNSVASKAVGMHSYIMEHHPDHEELVNARFQQGDVVTTIIKCAGGETITMKLDTTLPRYYSRGFAVHGTKALYDETNNSIVIDGEYEESFEWKPHWDNAEALKEKYDHPIWKRFLKEGVKGGHGGMDGLVYGAFFDCVINGYDMPINVYDGVAWMAITALSEQSIALGGAPVSFPDFTCGRWKEAEPAKNPGPYHLD